MIGACLLLMVAAPAVEVAIPNPKRTLPKLERFLDAAALLDARLGPVTARRLTNNIIDPFDHSDLASIGIDVRRPFRLVRPTPDERFVLVTSLTDAKQYETKLADLMKVKDVQTHDGFAVIGSKSRWQTLARRKTKTLYAMRATRALGLAHVDVKTLVKREATPMNALIRGVPPRWKRPQGTPKGADIYVRASALEGVDELDAALVLTDARAEAAFRFELDAITTVSLKDLVGETNGKQLLEPAEIPPVFELFGMIPSAGRSDVLRHLRAPDEAARHVTGAIQIALAADGTLTIAVEALDKRRAALMTTLLTKRFPRATAKAHERIVVVSFGEQRGATVRTVSKKVKSLDAPVVVTVTPSRLFEGLAARSRASDSAAIDATQLTVARFAYGGLRRIGRSLRMTLARARRGFVGQGVLFY